MADLYRVILPVEDLDRADAFWDRMLGLPIDKGVPGRHYIGTGGAILVLVSPEEHGGVHEPNPDCLYFRMPDLEATWRTARALGYADEDAGIESRPWGDVSFYATDPDGNPLCFIDDVRSDDAPHAAPYAGQPIPNLCKVILPTRDLAASDAFFAGLLGLEPDTAVPSRHFFATGSCELALVDPVEHARAHGEPPAEFRANPEMIYFAVGDLEAALARAEKLDMRMLDVHGAGLGIRTRPWGERSFYGLDPSGNTICFVDDRTLYTGSG